VADGNDINQTVAVRNAVHHSPLTNTDAPQVSCTLELHDSRWTRIRHERLDLPEYTPGDLGVKVLELFAR